jgi:hypothetical protein
MEILSGLIRRQEALCIRAILPEERRRRLGPELEHLLITAHHPDQGLRQPWDGGFGRRSGTLTSA